MRSKAKLLFLLIISAIMLQTAGFAKEKNDVPRKYRIQAYTKAVEKELGHKTETYEQSIIEAAYAYYGNSCQNNWDKESWKEAVQKAVELCRNKIAIAAAKAGEFGEKLLKALIQTTKDATDSISDWLNQKAQEYDENSNNNKDKDKTNKKEQLFI